MKPTNTVLCNVTEPEKENKKQDSESLYNTELAVTKEKDSLGDIWEWNLMYGIGNDVY
jgi:hypothetical protein